MSAQDAVALTRSLLQFDTVNPPGRERDCARYAGAMLQEWGYTVDYHEYEDSRTSVIARAGGADSPLCLTGHLDVVPLGARTWTKDPFRGETDGDKLYGRGSSDMKAGVAAILLAARSMAKKLAGTPGVVIVLTAAEEGGCIGSRFLSEQKTLMGKAGAMIVGEPTSNYPLVGHKGSVKFHARFKGVSAHGSMPHLGVNAIYKAARALAKLEAFDFGVPAHAVMGKPTLNVGTIEGGNTVNAVPDAANIGVDIRTVPGMDHARLIEKLKRILEDAELDIFSNLSPVWTQPDEEWVQRVFEICRPFVGDERLEPRTAPYMTDAANLLKVYTGAPTVVLGPGEAAMAHQTDEYCSMERIRQSVSLYEELVRDWCRA
ncbi:MAG TPA: M20 family metallopeptidase [Burkholderiales bacterium]|nr:M20 family metallopeptidase [Burkholderiales bacterium]